MTRYVRGDDGMKFTLFHTKESPLSNFFPCQFVVSDKTTNKLLTFYSSEQYFMYQKALTFNDMKSAEEIIREVTPRKVRALGRKVRNFNVERWNEVCNDAMKRALMEKFSQNQNIRKQLLATYGSIIAECSPRDCKWGIGLHRNSKAATQMNKWRGENKLGKALMEVRDDLWAMDQFKDDVRELEEMLNDEMKIKAYLEGSSNLDLTRATKRKIES